MRPILNRQISNLKESATLFINQLALKLRNEGKDICHLGFGESPFPVPEQMQDALRNNAQRKQYISGYGLTELRQAVADFSQKEFSYNYSYENIFIGPGSKELIFQLLYLLEGPLMVPAPSWVSYGPQARIRSKTFLPIKTDFKNGYRLQAEELDAACSSQDYPQKILILNNPSNPTGSVHSAVELRDLAEVCRKHGVIVISDEIYALTQYDGQQFEGIAKYYPEATITTSGISKAFSAGGWRLGFAMIPDEFAEITKPLSAFVSETFSCVSAPIQFGALPGFAGYDELREYVERCRDIHAATGHYLCQQFRKIGLNCPEPQGAFYLFPDFENFKDKLSSRGIKTSTELSKRLLDEVGVALLPGADFYMPENYLAVRIASVDYDGAQVLHDFPGKTELTQELNLSLFPKLVEACRRINNWLK
ncbi:MAG: aminotransferase class I/II-fold pyridoxal phosphate-dependent enzyme [SAR324 cluster bacterium]|nr:aminotransferase class I/II-fold pyridoxal phosphate-dependent enzyme [SAR324 cluster bacterium]MBL7035378.1 aminotransferase class I/II-fold pyridoxal phosphate-dependent enzyme [SAR324 cluster bacterium]